MEDVKVEIPKNAEIIYSPEKQMRGKKRKMEERVKSMIIVTAKNTQRKTVDMNKEFEKRENMMK